MGHRQVWTIWQNLQLRAGANADTELSARVPVSLAQLPVFQGFFSFFHEIAKKVKGLPLLNDGNTKQFVSAAVEDGRTGTIKNPAKPGFRDISCCWGLLRIRRNRVPCRFLSVTEAPRRGN